MKGCLMASRMFLSARVCAVSLALQAILAFFSTFMAKIFPVLVPCTLRTWKTLP